MLGAVERPTPKNFRSSFYGGQERGLAAPGLKQDERSGQVREGGVWPKLTGKNREEGYCQGGVPRQDGRGGMGREAAKEARRGQEARAQRQEA